MTSLALLLLLIVVVTVLGSVVLVEIRRYRRERLLADLVEMFGPVVARGREHPRDLVGWAAVARATRQLFPEACGELDAAAGGRFPFSAGLVEAAHARWTAEWLAWERQHDLDYKRKADAAEATLDRAEGDAASHARAQLAAIEQEKLQLYQQRYEEYVLVGKALAAIAEE